MNNKVNKTERLKALNTLYEASYEADYMLAIIKDCIKMLEAKPNTVSSMYMYDIITINDSLVKLNDLLKEVE